MPGKLSKKDEKLWTKAKIQARKQGYQNDDKRITSIFEKMKGGKK
jgi:hypothetical protein